MRRLTTISISLTAGLLMVSAALATTFSGRLTTSAYTWKTEELNGASGNHVRAYHSVRFSARNIGDTGISFHTYSQISGDLLDDASGHHAYRIYNAYLQHRSSGKLGLDFRAGRQRIYEGVGYGTIDGVRIQANPADFLQLTGYVGTLAPLDPEDGIASWSDGHLWGGEAVLDVQQTVFTVSFADRSRAPLPYLTPGGYTGLSAEYSSRQFRRLGFDVRQTLLENRLELYGQVDLDADEMELDEFQIVGHAQVTPDIRLTGEYHHREPTIFQNSILSVFEVSSDQEVAGRLSYRMNPLISLSGGVARVVYDDDSSTRIDLGMMVGNGYIGYGRRIGYGGENDSFSASFAHWLSPKLQVKTSGNLSAYRLYSDQPDLDRAITGTLGLTYRPKKKLSLDIEGHYLRNKFYATDFRMFLRGTLWFFKK